jgi:hypothetical protein
MIKIEPRRLDNLKACPLTERPTHTQIFPHEIDRARWTFDVRRQAEESGFGWSYFAMSGRFRSHRGQLFQSKVNFGIERSVVGNYVPQFSRAFFGAVRP